MGQCQGWGTVGLHDLEGAFPTKITLSMGSLIEDTYFHATFSTLISTLSKSISLYPIGLRGGRMKSPNPCLYTSCFLRERTQHHGHPEQPVSSAGGS